MNNTFRNIMRNLANVINYYIVSLPEPEIILTGITNMFVIMFFTIFIIIFFI